MSTIGQGRIKIVLRLFVTRTVEQSAEITVELEDDDYEDIKVENLIFKHSLIKISKIEQAMTILVG